ncbi:MAG: TonB-dependent receptor [Vicinamibacterales bacterium]
MQSSGRKVALSLVVALLAASPALAIEGKVVHRDTKEAVANAEVSILGRPGVVRTDEEGRFVWKPDPTPPFEILVIMPGGRYMKPVFVEKLPSDGVLVLEVAPLLEESVTVAGSAPRIDTAPGSGTTLLSAREIEVRQPTNLTQVLENVPGVSTVSEGHAAVPAVRGLARGRTLILIDGARVTSERRVGPSATFLDPFVLEGVEIARGPGSVAYGSDAFGGVIYARTRRVAAGAPFGFRFVGSAGAGVPEGRAGVEISKGLAKGGVLFQAHYRTFGDFRSPNGTVLNSGANDQGFLARAEHEIGGGTLSVSWQSDFGRDVERPRTNSNVTRFFYPTEDSHRLTTSYEVTQVGGLNRVVFSGFFGTYTQVTDQDTFATSTKPRSVERADVRSKDFHLRAAAEKMAGPGKVEFGADVNGRFGLRALDISFVADSRGALVETRNNVSVDSARRTDLGVYLIGQVAPAPRFTAAAGIRGDHVTVANEGGYFGDRSTSNSAASGYVSVTAGSFNGFTVTGQVSRGFRDPMLSDRFYRGPTGRGYITGNPDLRPETSLQFDFALRHVAGRYRSAFYAYEYRITDLVERYETARDYFFYRNRGRARLRGVELEAQADLGGGLTLEISGQVTRGLALDDDTPLDDVPSESIAVQARKQLGTKAFAQFRVAAHALDDRPGPTERRLPGYTLLDASGGYKLSDQVELRFGARNLLDMEYLLSPDSRAVLAPGISGLVTVLVEF